MDNTIDAEKVRGFDDERMIAENIRLQRERRAWTQEQLADAARVDVRTVQRAERGKRISAESLQAIAGAFDITVAQLKETPEWIAKLKGQFKLIRLTAIQRAAELRNYLGTGGCLVNLDDINSEAEEDAVAAFERDLTEIRTIWPDLDAVQKLDVLRSMRHHFSAFARLGLTVAAGLESLYIRSQHIEKPFPLEVLYIVISKASAPKLFAMRDRSVPMHFQ